MEYYKKQSKKGKNNDAIPSVRGSINPNNSMLLMDQSMDMDMNDSFIFKMSPGKQNDRDTSMKSRKSGRKSIAPQMVSSGCQADDTLNIQMLEEKELEIQLLKAKKGTAPTGKKENAGEMEILQKYKFDNQILMKKLTEYKKAEKGAMGIVTDYE
jgi:hypothetical protein